MITLSGSYFIKKLQISNHFGRWDIVGRTWQDAKHVLPNNACNPGSGSPPPDSGPVLPGEGSWPSPPPLPFLSSFLFFHFFSIFKNPNFFHVTQFFSWTYVFHLGSFFLVCYYHCLKAWKGKPWKDFSYFFSSYSTHVLGQVALCCTKPVAGRVKKNFSWKFFCRTVSIMFLH